MFAKAGVAMAPSAHAAQAARDVGLDSNFLTMLDIVPVGSLSGAE
jgi:hypothetical protein